MRFAIDVETECTVTGCLDHGKSLCREGHSLSPWHSRITVAAAVGEDGSRAVFRDNESGSAAVNLACWLPANFEVVGHNFKFDWLHLARHGFEIPLEKWVGDSQLAAYVSTLKIPDGWLAEYEQERMKLGGSHRKAGKHSLKTLAPYFLGVAPFWEPEHGHDDNEYVLKDAEYTLRLVKHLEGILQERGEFAFYKEKQLEWTKMLLVAEWRGIELDTERLAAMESDLESRSHDLKNRLDEQWKDAHKEYVEQERKALAKQYYLMHSKAAARLKSPTLEHMQKTADRYEALYLKAKEKLPTGIEYDSPKQMAWLLRDYLGYEISGFDGEESTGAEVLERLANEGRKDVETYLEWRKANKIRSSFLPTYRELSVKEQGRTAIHPIYNPATTRTGRLSSERPNCQQVPEALRPLFKAREGYSFIGYDAAAIEAKLIALYSEDETLFRIIETGTSLHDFNTVNYFALEGIDYSEVKKRFPKHRAAAKNVGFALFYNAGANRIRISLAEKGFLLPESECRAIHKRFKQAFATAIEFGNAVVNHLESGQVITNLLGRPINIENPDEAYMKAFNKLIQSSASDLNLEGSYVAWKRFQELSLDATPLLFVHDFVCFEVKDEHVEQADKELRHALTNFNLVNKHGQIKLEIDGGVSKRWEK